MRAAIDADLALAAADLLEGRRVRDALFGDDRDGFGEPAWDMLLALVVADASGHGLDQATLAEAARSRGACAQRYVEWLIARDLALIDGPEMALSDRGRAVMTAYLGRGH